MDAIRRSALHWETAERKGGADEVCFLQQDDGWRKAGRR
jgi:hypothetical protein